MNDFSKNTGVVLRGLRVEKKLSQEELASRSDVHRTYISLIERGIKSPTLNVLYRISKSLDMKLSALITEIELLDKNIE